MRTKINIKGFKCFQDIDVPLNKLAIFAGANGQGKSTAIQSLLLLRHTVECIGLVLPNNNNRINTGSDQSTKISLNDNYCLSLGDSHSVVNILSNDFGICLNLIEGDQHFSAELHNDGTTDALYLTLNKTSQRGMSESPLFKREFYYLNAERIGPRIRQNIKYTEFPHTGFYGELSAQLLSEKSGFTPVSHERWFGDSKNKNLEQQVSLWLDYIIPGTKVKSGHTGSFHSAEILLENNYSASSQLLPTNVGFGISYALPIIITGLIATKGAFFVVENPEAHLHPSAQSKIGRFLAVIANSGVNIIIETHSEHIINGIQLAIADKLIDSDLPIVNFFGPSESSNQPFIETVQFQKNGRLDKWPKGFFDQAQIDYAHLINVK